MLCQGIVANIYVVKNTNCLDGKAGSLIELVNALWRFHIFFTRSCASSKALVRYLTAIYQGDTFVCISIHINCYRRCIGTHLPFDTNTPT